MAARNCSVRVPAKCGQVLVPEGLATIAQRFNVGIWRACTISPEGTADGVHSQPSLRDLHTVYCRFPMLKRWAIIGHPFGMMRQILVTLDRQMKKPHRGD